MNISGGERLFDMTICGNIKDALLRARIAKNQDELSFLQFVLGEVDNKATKIVGSSKVCSDEDVIKVLKSIEKSLNENIKLGNVNAEKELQILLSFLPKQMTREELSEVLSKVSGKMPEMMKYLKEHHSGQYDGKLASEVAKELSNVQ